MAWPDKVEDDKQWETAVDNWRQSPEAKKRKKSSDDAATDGDPGASVFQGDVAWLDKVKDDKQRKTAVGNWRQSPETTKSEKF